MEQWALITGATAGIGQELASVFAAHGHNLLLVARNEIRLRQTAVQLETAHQIKTDVLPGDLSRPNAAAELFQAVGERRVEVLVNNAGFGRYGLFAKTELAVLTEMMQVNMCALVELTHLFLKPMLQRRSGRILNVSSTAAFQPGPTFNIYYATKAFVYSFSYALADEVADTGVTVTTLCPGVTRTEFQERANLSMDHGLGVMDARTVAEAGYRGLMLGKRVVIPGVLNKLGAFLGRRAPQRLTNSIVKRLHGPRQASRGSA